MFTFDGSVHHVPRSLLSTCSVRYSSSNYRLLSSFPHFLVSTPHVHLELRSLLFSTTDVPFQLFDLDVSVSCEFLFIVLFLPLDSFVEIIQCFQILIDLLLLFELLHFSPVFLHLRTFQFDPLFLESVEIRLQIVFVRCSKEDKRMFNQSFLFSSFNCLSRWSSRACRSIDRSGRMFNRWVSEKWLTTTRMTTTTTTTS